MSAPMRRVRIALAAVASSILLAACGKLPFDRLGSSVTYSAYGTAPPAGARVAVTASRRAARASARSAGLLGFSDESMLRPELAAAKRGALVGRFTPAEFFLTIGQLTVYNRIGKAYTYSSLLTSNFLYKGMDTPTISLIRSEDYLSDLVLKNGNFYQGFCLMPGHNGIAVGNAVCVDLGAAYEGMRFPREIDRTKVPGIEPRQHWFDIGDALNPYDTDGVYTLAFGEDNDVPSLVDVKNVPPPYDSPAGRLNGTMGQFYLPGPTLDFSAYERPEVVLYWELRDLIEVYDNNTPADPSDDLVTFALADPFPVSVVLRERTDPVAAPGDASAPGPIRFPACDEYRFNNDEVTKVAWINPTDEDFCKVVIRRKAESAPTGYDDGDLVFDGRRATWFDVDGERGVDYHYFIYAVDYAGNRSEGVDTHFVFGSGPDPER